MACDDAYCSVDDDIDHHLLLLPVLSLPEY